MTEAFIETFGCVPLRPQIDRWAKSSGVAVAAMKGDYKFSRVLAEIERPSRSAASRWRQATKLGFRFERGDRVVRAGGRGDQRCLAEVDRRRAEGDPPRRSKRLPSRLVSHQRNQMIGPSWEPAFFHFAK